MNSTVTTTQTADDLRDAIGRVNYYRTVFSTAKSSTAKIEAGEALDFWIGKRAMLELRLEQGR